MKVLAIDPGNIESGICLVDADDYRPLRKAKLLNEEVLCSMGPIPPDTKVAIEMIGHYGTGMPAGKEVFDTCVWIGRFMEHLLSKGVVSDLVMRRDVKLHICGTSKAKDSNIRQALVDRFAPGEPNYGKGTKKKPGWFYGFSEDMWQAYALAVAYLDYLNKRKEQ